MATEGGSCLLGGSESETSILTDFDDVVCLGEGSTDGEESSEESGETHV